MLGKEKFCLKWNEYQENIVSGFKDLRHDKEFTDVTLACGDGQLAEAHITVLTTFSPLFKSLLKTKKLQHPLIYMRGMKFEELSAMLDFLYCGEANVYQEQLDSFLALAKELKLQGLTEEIEGLAYSETPFSSTPIKEEYFQQNEQSTPREKLDRTAFENETEDPISTTEHILVSEESNELDQKIKSMILSSKNFITNHGRRRKAFLCKVCGKEMRYADLKRHIEANHLKGVSHSCDVCGKISRSRDGLRVHIYKKHRA